MPIEAAIALASDPKRQARIAAEIARLAAVTEVARIAAEREREARENRRALPLDERLTAYAELAERIQQEALAVFKREVEDESLGNFLLNFCLIPVYLFVGLIEQIVMFIFQWKPEDMEYSDSVSKQQAAFLREIKDDLVLSDLCPTSGSLSDKFQFVLCVLCSRSLGNGATALADENVIDELLKTVLRIQPEKYQGDGVYLLGGNEYIDFRKEDVEEMVTEIKKEMRDAANQYAADVAGARVADAASLGFGVGAGVRSATTRRMPASAKPPVEIPMRDVLTFTDASATGLVVGVPRTTWKGGRQ